MSNNSAIGSALENTLQGRCDFSDAGIALYTSDASNYRQVPLGVVFPKTIEDIVTTTTLCAQHSVPVLMRGAGTSQNGQCVNHAVIIDCSQHLNHVLEIDADNRTALIEPGVVCDSLKAAAEAYGLTWGPDPATHSRCTLGGMIGNNSCGPRSMLAGKTVENVLELEVLTPTGERFWVGPTSEEELQEIITHNDERGRIYRELKEIRDQYGSLIKEKYPDIKRRVSGYNLDQLLPENGFNVARALVGSEGTCISVLRARLQLIENPTYKTLFVLGFADIFTAGDSVPEIMPFSPIAMEGLDWTIVGGLIERDLRLDDVALLPKGKAWLLVELAGSDKATLADKCQQFSQAMQASEKVASVLRVDSKETEKRFWAIREQGASATSMSLKPEDPDPIVGWEDTAVDPMRLGDYLRDFSALVDKYGYKTSMYGHFGDGCIHARITFDTRTEEGVKTFRAFSQDIARLVVQYGGSLSGEHGDGQAKAEFLPIMFGEELINAFERFKRVWDPDNRMNPRKLVNPYRMDENLRFSPDYRPQPVTTALTFYEDIGGFTRTTERCIGMGKCRSASGAMCPSYQATLEERYSTRGRAHLLHELVRGELITDGFANRDIADSLEHCLSCKACSSECPTQVDIAMYKAEFMHKHFAHHKRPLNHVVFGRIAQLLPGNQLLRKLANQILTGAGSKPLKSLLKLDSESDLPTLAPAPFSALLNNIKTDQDDSFYYAGDSGNTPVVLWVDTVNNHYRPHLLQSAVSILVALNYRVAVARQHFCCGRPLYEHGYLDQARSALQSILDNFHSTLPADAPVLVLEPSCLSVFKQELLRMFPEDSRATALHQRATAITDWLNQQQSLNLTQLPHGLMHLHCHSKAIHSDTAERALMERCFENLEEPESGCCGMAGTYGIKQKTKATADWLYQRALGRRIKSTGANTVIVANGFSCTEAIRQHSKTEALHPIQVVERCISTPS